MARMTNFRSAAIATGNAIDDSAYDNVKIVADEITGISEVAALITEKDVDFAQLADVLQTLGDAASEHLASLAVLDLAQLINDLDKGNYLGNRKIDINLALNVTGITENLIKNDPAAAEALWVANSTNISYDKATIIFTDGDSVELPFLSDNNPTVVTNTDGLLVQLNRTDVVAAVTQEDLIYSFTVLDNTTYTVTIDNIDFTYTSGVGATRGEIVTGLTNQINVGTNPWTAYNETDNIRIKADVTGNPFLTTVDNNMLVTTDVDNVVAGNYPTAFLNKLNATSYNSFTLDSVSNTIRFFDTIGTNSNIERIQLHTTNTSTGFKESAPAYYWAKTTSALETLSMRAGDIIKIGNEIDNIVLLASSIQQVLEIQDLIPELIDTYVDGVPQGDTTIYNRLSELHDIYQQLTAITTIYADIVDGGTNYIKTNSDNIGSIGTVAADIANVDTVGSAISNVNATGSSIANVNTVATNITDINNVADAVAKVTTVSDNILSVNAVNDSIANVNSVSGDLGNIDAVATDVIPNITEILLADDNAATATAQATIATNQANIATTKADEITAINGTQNALNLTAGSAPTAYYNSNTGLFTFGIPQGAKGDKGEAFTVNAVGDDSSKSNYDTEPTGFSYLSIDQNLIYFKQSDTSGDWSIGAPFGKGDTGNGIDNITYTSSTGTGQSQAGETDTYTITYTDATTDILTIKNGSIPTKVDIGLGNVDNTADADKPISSATSGALALKANIDNPTFTGTVNGVTKAHVGLGNVDNVSAANLRDRSSHTGTQLASTISDFDTEVANNSAVSANTAKVSNVTTNLSYSTDTNTGTIVSSDGTNATIPEATGSVAGLMTTTHHNKLDGIEAGATADQTASEILAAIKTVDGSGSGLNADLLDNRDSTSFANAQGDATKTFKVADAVNGDEAISKTQFETSYATSTVGGAIKVGENLTINDGVLSADSAWKELNFFEHDCTINLNASQVLYKADEILIRATLEVTITGSDPKVYCNVPGGRYSLKVSTVILNGFTFDMAWVNTNYNWFFYEFNGSGTATISFIARVY